MTRSEQQRARRDMVLAADPAPALSLRDLTVEFATDAGVVRAVNGVSFDVRRGEVLGVVGETGSGKSVSMLATLGLLSVGNVRSIRGEALFEGRDLLRLNPAKRRSVLGAEIGMIFQDPTSALDPVQRVGAQIAEALLIHQPNLHRREARSRVVALLDSVGVPQPDVRYDQYPHQFSGGMCQRVGIAMAIINEPRLIVADEPTTALDVSVQAQIMEVLRLARERTGAAMVLISHNLGLVAETADRVCVMYAGRVVEQAPVAELFARPRHPYTVGLLRCLPGLREGGPRLDPISGQPPDPMRLPPGCAFAPRCGLGDGRDQCRTERPALRPISGGPTRSACHFAEELRDPVPYVKRAPAGTASAGTASAGTASAGTAPAGTASAGQPVTPDDAEPVVAAESVAVRFAIRKGVLSRASGWVHAVDGISFSVPAGATFSLVGESGCGKSTTLRMIPRLIEPTGGALRVMGNAVADAGRRELRRIRQQVQTVFQDPYASLNPQMSAGRNVAEPLRLHRRLNRSERRQRVTDLFEQVGLRTELVDRFPAQLSGGQRQRVAIARALALQPRLILLDEPVSSLDVSVQAQVLNLLQDVQRETGVAYLMASHDLSVVRHMSDTVAVMYLGRIVEVGPRDELYRRPLHPYTHALLASVPVPDPATRGRARRAPLRGDIPSPVDPPSGCRFRTRCPIAQQRCAEEEPALIARDANTQLRTACHFAQPADSDVLAASQS